ncbi:MAG: hypothetical protein AB1Z23_02155 [Eubacteriales bacterium]
MNISIKVKKIGSKRALLNDLNLQIDASNSPISLEEFIKAVVIQNVEDFNNRIDGKNIIPFLTQKEIEEKSKTGKIAGNALMNDKKQDICKAVDAALLAHEDGLYKVFVDAVLYDDLKEDIPLKQNCEVVFVRLTFLTGGIFYG